MKIDLTEFQDSNIKVNGFADFPMVIKIRLIRY